MTQTGLGKGTGLDPATFSESYKRYFLFMLTVVATLNFVDRQLMSILMEPIKAEFSLTDSQLGFLTGFAFSIFYATVGLPLAKLADRSDRRRLTAIVIVLWSFMTALCGAATGFVTLLLARIGVGIGESGSAPAIQSMISDVYPAKQRSSIIGLQSTGVYVGILLGFLLGGWINEFFGWRMAFAVVGLPGVIVAVIFYLTVREPGRGYVDQVADSGGIPSFGATLKYLWRSPSYRHIPMAVSLYAFVAYGSMAWAPSFFIRTHGMSTGEIGTWLALAAGLAGGMGCYLGGLFSDHVVNRTGDERWHMWIPAIMMFLAVPLLFGVFLWPTKTPALLMMTVSWFIGNTWLGPVQSVIAGLAPLRMRAMAIAILLFVNNLIGLGMGPQVVGILSDVMRPAYGVDSLRYGLLIALSVASLWSIFHFLMAARTLRADLANAVKQ